MSNQSFQLVKQARALQSRWRLIVPAILLLAVITFGGATVGVLALLGIIAPTAVDYTLTPPANTTMQSFTAADCTAMPTYSTLELSDSRDSQSYRIRKMPDGKCWMIDNLKLGGTGSDLTLTPSDSNVSSSYVLPANPIITSAQRVTNGRCDSTVISASGSGGYLTCDGTTTVTGTDDNENYNFTGYADPSSTNNSYYDSCLHGAPGLDPNSLTDCGYLYNWYTATAGTGVYDTPADTAANANSAPSSICPSGWQLPRAGAGSTTGNDFATLNGAMYSGTLSATTSSSAAYIANWNASGPFAGSYSGYWDSGFGYQGYFGYYWSASAYSTTSARVLYFGYNYVYPGNGDSNKYYGYAVRCVSQ